jgi:hypothetical protein
MSARRVEIPPLVLLDTREQRPAEPFTRSADKNFPLATTRVGLSYGDYSLPGLERYVFIERKSVPDLIGTCVGARVNSVGESESARDRFERAIDRAVAATPPGERQIRALVIEGQPTDVWEEGLRRDRRFGAMSIFGSLNSWFARFGIAPVWAHTAEGAAWWIGRILAEMWSAHTGGEEAVKARKRGYAAQLPWLRGEPTAEAIEAGARAALRVESWRRIQGADMETLRAIERDLVSERAAEHTDAGDDLVRVRRRLRALTRQGEAA